MKNIFFILIATLFLAIPSKSSGQCYVTEGANPPQSVILANWDNVEGDPIKDRGAAIVGEARTTQKPAVDNGDAVIIALNQFGEIVLAGFNWAVNAIQVLDINPLSENYVAFPMASETNVTDGTYYAYVDMMTFRKVGFQIYLACDAGTVTLTVEMSIQNDGTAPASCTYQDVTNAVFGVASVVATAGTNSSMLLDNTEILSLAHYVRLKIVAATGANTGDWTIHMKKLY